MLVELPFASFFLSKLLGTSADVDIHHLASLDPEMYRNLLFLKSYEGDVEELGLNFTVVNNDLGEAQVTRPTEYDKWLLCVYFSALFLSPVWFLFVALIIHFPPDAPLLSPDRDKARHCCRSKPCCSAEDAAALLTVPACLLLHKLSHTMHDRSSQQLLSMSPSLSKAVLRPDLYMEPLFAQDLNVSY